MTDDRDDIIKGLRARNRELEEFVTRCATCTECGICRFEAQGLVAAAKARKADTEKRTRRS